MKCHILLFAGIERKLGTSNLCIYSTQQSKGSRSVFEVLLPPYFIIRVFRLSVFSTHGFFLGSAQLRAWEIVCAVICT